MRPELGTSGDRTGGGALGDIALASGTALLAVIGYHRILRLWWMHDDFFLLRYVQAHHPIEYFFEPSVWRELPFRMLTPVLMLSLDADLALFGLAPAGFYAHQLAALALGAVALFAVLRLWLPRTWSAAAALLWLAGPPLAAGAPFLMVRHYLEALPLAALAVGAFVLAVRRDRWRWSVASALLYLVAMLAKEIAVPLLVVLVALPDGDYRRRCRLALPHAGALAVYVADRLFMLGTLGGVYGWAVRLSDLPLLAVELPGKVAGELTAGWMTIAVITVVLLVLLSFAPALESRRWAIALFVGAAAALLPVLPVSTEIRPRYALPAWLFLVVAFAAAGAAWSHFGGARRAVAWAVLGLVVAGAGAGFQRAAAKAFGEAAALSAENRFFLRLGAGDVLRRPLEDPPSQTALRSFKEGLLGLPRGAGWFYDDLYLCRPHPDLARLWGFVRATRQGVELTDQLPAIRRRYCSSIRETAALSARFEATEDGLFWNLGPYPGGYAFVFGDGREAFAVPRRGGYRLARRSSLDLRVRHRDRRGWVTYSPELHLDLHPGARADWRRGADRVSPGSGP